MQRDEIDPEVRRRAVAAARGREKVRSAALQRHRGGRRHRRVCGPVTSECRADDRERASGGTRSDASEIVDCAGRYVAPGLIDMHVHFESSMLTPGPYTEAVCPRGTTTIFCDPHELANVAGVEGVRYAVDASRGLPVRFIVQAPSCVPPQPGLEVAGHDLMGPEIAEMLSWPEVGGLAE